MKKAKANAIVIAKDENLRFVRIAQILHIDFLCKHTRGEQNCNAHSVEVISNVLGEMVGLKNRMVGYFLTSKTKLSYE